MKRIISFIIFCILFLGAGVFADENKETPDQLFYAGNISYQKMDYARAVEDYKKVLESGKVSSALYYNIGNAYFKLGKIGYAILFYEKARRLTPQDADLKSNLAYAKTLVGNPAYQLPLTNPVVSLIKKPFEDLSLRTITSSALILYVILVALLALFIANRVVGRKFRAMIILIFLLLTCNLTGLALRYYDDKIVSTGVVVQKSADAKYEPIDKSTTYYRIQEGDEVRVLKTRSSWRQIERADGKIGWVDASSVELI